MLRKREVLTVMRLTKILAVIALVAAIGTMAGCNTVRGVGRDIERGGEAIQRGASK